MKFFMFAICLAAAGLAGCGNDEAKARAHFDSLIDSDAGGHIYGVCNQAVTHWLATGWPVPFFPHWLNVETYPQSYIWKKHMQKCTEGQRPAFYACRDGIRQRTKAKQTGYYDFGYWYQANKEAEPCFKSRVVAMLTAPGYTQ